MNIEEINKRLIIKKKEEKKKTRIHSNQAFCYRAHKPLNFKKS